MIVKSFIKDYFGLKPVDVEIVFTTGLPQISILGLPDRVISESTKRIQSALVAQGYQMPKAKHVLVNLWPREIRKTSLGVDLAIALGILAESGQKNVFEGRGDVAVYGELTLSGDVRAPKDIDAVSSEHGPVITGGPLRPYDFPVSILENLRADCIRAEERVRGADFVRPPFRYKQFSEEAGKLLVATAVGEHSLLLAGPPGSGKTSFVETVPSLMRAPSVAMFQQSRNVARYFGLKLDWLPVIAPHHTTPPLTMLGGGVPPRPGQIVRAHGGVLILDELLEFDTNVQSALRETLETGKVQIARGGQIEEFPADFLTLATTNLCKCGEFIPHKSHGCRCSSMQLKRYMEKLTGPFVDRMTMLAFTHEWTPGRAAGKPQNVQDMLERAEKAREFAWRARRQVFPNEQLSLDELQATVESAELLASFEAFRSHRRKLAFWRVARTFADIAQSESITEEHVVEAQKYAVRGFAQLRTF